MRLLFSRTWYILALLIVVILAAMTWANARFFSERFAARSAFLLPYTATRALLVEGVSPYDESLISRAEKIVQQYEGKDTEVRVARFVFPLYAVFIFAPFAMIEDFLLAYSIWLTFLESILLGMAFFTWRLMEWDAERWVFVVFLLTSLLSFFVVQPFINGNPVILVAFLLIVTLIALRYRFEELAAIALVFSTIKIHLTLLVTLYIIILAIAQHRGRFLIWFVSVMAMAMLLSFSLVPDWIIQNLREAYRFFDERELTIAMMAMLPKDSQIGNRIVWILMGGAGFVLLTEWLFTRSTDSKRVLWVISLSLVVTFIVIFENNPSNLILLYLPVMMILATFDMRMGIQKRVVILSSMIGLLLLPWGGILLDNIRDGQGGKLSWDVSPWLTVAIPWILLVGLYWIRWWIINPVQFSLSRE